ncbi:ribonuclease Y [Bacilli bacterium PM5-3]|nr:ribonuclease Y [Bacilli bacterium PM5-3]MDH6604126.1 ribonuclease Y [Bacilli bacterium PM5-9]
MDISALDIVIFIVAFILGALFLQALKHFSIIKANTKADEIVEEANKKAINIEKHAILDAKTLAHEYKMEAEQDIKARRQEISELELNLSKKEQAADKRELLISGRQEILTNKEEELERKYEKLKKEEELLEDKKKEQITLLENISGFSKQEAKQELVEQVKSQIQNEMSALIKEAEEEAKEKSEATAKNLVAIAIQRYSAEQANERTIATVALPSEEMKGRIIGREGRNIRAIEAATGVDLIIDDTPETITVSCFDPIRREIARQSLDALIQDGRIQPSRIEELVKKSKSNVDKTIKEAGEEAIFELGITKMPKELVTLVGKLKYRTSYGQSALKHSMEVAFLTGMLAAEIGENEQLARRAGLLHDIGKAVDFEQEGSHIELGAKYAKKYGENPVVINAIESHHGNVPANGIIPILVAAADALSASRPGARMESLENYIQRLEKLEKIGNEFAGVESCYAIQAGREIRVIVKPDEVDDIACYTLARDIKNKIEKDLTYPGQIKVSVLRETKASEIAK